jgi:AraC family transcriptional regulator
MSERNAVSQQLPTGVLAETSVAPILYLSSVEAGWEGLVAQAFHEPSELEGWIGSAPSDISLILFSGGGMRLAERHDHGSWNEACIRHGDLILQSGAARSYEVRWQSLSAMPTQTFHIRLSRELVVRTAEEAAGCDPGRVALTARSGFQDPLLTQIGLALWRELEQPAPAGKLYAQTAAQLLTVHLLRHYSSSGAAISEPAGVLTQQQVHRVTDFVHAHLSHDLSLALLAQQIGFSPYHFARLFRRTTGESPHQFVMRQRVEHAQRLLMQRDAPLAAVALACGFANQSHFTQSFKRQIGLTPRAYRQARSIGADI